MKSYNYYSPHGIRPSIQLPVTEYERASEGEGARERKRDRDRQTDRQTDRTRKLYFPRIVV